MKKRNITLAVQFLFGLIILAAGINKLYLFMPVPEQMPAGKAFIDFLYATGYLMYVVALVEIIGGGLLLLNRLVPLALLILAPVTTNILLFHIFLEQKGLPMGIFIFSLQVLLFFLHKEKFLPLLQNAPGKKEAAPFKELSEKKEQEAFTDVEA